MMNLFAALAALMGTAMKLPPNRSALSLARIEARLRLTVLRYEGNIRVATDVLSVLVENAVQHGVPVPAPEGARIAVRLAVTASGGLVIEVRDLVPSFPRFDAAVRGELGCGL